MPDEDSTAYLSLQNVEVLSGAHCLVRVDSLTAAGGTLLHLTGENGAGKTTLLRALTGEAAYRGQIRIGGSVPGTVAAKVQTAYVPTDAVLLDDLTVAENMMFMARAWRREASTLHTLAQAFGLQQWWEAWPTQLSRGTRQKVALSIGLGLELPLTLLDEPFGTLDTASRTTLLNAIRARVTAGGVVIVTTHGDELASVERQLIRLADGALMA